MKGGRRGTPRSFDHSGTAPKASKTCEEKRLYVSRAEAAAHMLLLPSSDRVGLETYVCRECGFFHLGHRRKP